jgi:organic radical activating enzyme
MRKMFRFQDTPPTFSIFSPDAIYCQHCYINFPTRRQILSINTIIRYWSLYNLRQKSNLILLGGEPTFIHTDLAASARSLGYRHHDTNSTFS